MSMVPFVGFAPDADPTTPGVFTDCAAIVPTERGFAAAGAPVAASVAALAAECRGAVVAYKLDGTRRVFAGTQTKLYELTSTTWTDRSRAGNYTGSTESRWSFCQFGDTSIASNLTDAMQSSASGAFADIAAAPKAKIVVSASNNFVLAFYTNEGTYGVSPDRWWCCAQGNQTDWTPNVATGSNTGRLIAIGGPINAAATLGDYVVAYKNKAVFLGSYAGGSVVWQWQLIPGSEAGAVGPEALCDIGVAHFFVGDNNFWIFDGTRPATVGDGVVKEWFNSNCSGTYRYRTKCSFDKQRGLVYIDFASVASTSGAIDSRLVFHIKRKFFGRNNGTREAPLTFITPGVTIDGLDAYAATIDALPAVPFDSPFWAGGARVQAYFNGSHQLVSDTGVTGASSFMTGDLGDDWGESMLDEVRLRFLRAPTTASVIGFTKEAEGEGLVTGDSSSLADGKFDIRQTARFHRLSFSMTGEHEFTGMDVRPRSVGQRGR